jgi:hypothetical protein
LIHNYFSPAENFFSLNLFSTTAMKALQAFIEYYYYQLTNSLMLLFKNKEVYELRVNPPGCPGENDAECTWGPHTGATIAQAQNIL